MLCAIPQIGSGRSTPFHGRDSRMSSQASHSVSLLAMALPHDVRVEACMRCSQSSLIGVGTRASGEVESETQVAGAAEMTGVSPAERTGVRHAGTTAQTRGIEALHAHHFVVADPLSTHPVANIFSKKEPARGQSEIFPSTGQIPPRPLRDTRWLFQLWC